MLFNVLFRARFGVYEAHNCIFVPSSTFVGVAGLYLVIVEFSRHIQLHVLDTKLLKEQTVKIIIRLCGIRKHA